MPAALASQAQEQEPSFCRGMSAPVQTLSSESLETANLHEPTLPLARPPVHLAERSVTVHGLPAAPARLSLVPALPLAPPQAAPPPPQPCPVVSSGAAPSTNSQIPEPKEDPNVKVFEFDFSVFDFLRHEDSGACSGSDVVWDSRADAEGCDAPVRLAEALPPPAPWSLAPEAPGLRLGAVTAEPLVLPAAIEKLRRGEQPPPRQMKAKDSAVARMPFNDAGSAGEESLADDDWPVRPRRSAQVATRRMLGSL